METICDRPKRRAISSSSPERTVPSAQSNPHLEEPPTKRHRNTEESLSNTVERHIGHHFSGSVACDSSTVQNGDRYAGRRHEDTPMPGPSNTGVLTSQGAPGFSRQPHQSWPQPVAHHRGHIANGNIAQDSAHVHYGDNHFHGNTGAPTSASETHDIAVILESLSFAQMDTRRETISRAHANTCKWLFDQSEYLNWRRPELISQHYGFLWIKAKPGSGKSTLMKFLLRSAEEQLPLDTVISFFFHARGGDGLQKSLEGMYRSLLHQLFTKFPNLQNILMTLPTAQHGPQAWSLDSLKSLFHDAVLRLKNVRLTCFIDALDECPEDEVRDLINALGDLSHSAVEKKIDFHVCFASRHYPYITMDECQHLMLDGQEGHEQDISDYIGNKLVGKGRGSGKGKGNVMNEIKDEVQARAQGVFLWAVLVVQILNKEHDQGSDAHQLRCRLKDIPTGLHELFQDILRRGMKDHDAHNHLLHILEWVLYAQRPLSPEELYFALRSGISDPVVLEPWDPEEIGLQTIHLFILHASKGLTEVTRGKRAQKYTVQFIHESVRDYLRGRDFKATSPLNGAISEASAHEYLKHCCLFILKSKVPQHPSIPRILPKAKSEEAKKLRTTTSALFPFLEYSGTSMIYHADKAHSNGISQLGFLRDFPLLKWININDVFAIYDTRRYGTKRTTMTSICTRLGAESLLALVLDEFAEAFSTLEIEYALQSVLATGNLEAFMRILCIPKIPKGSKSSKYDIDGTKFERELIHERLRTSKAMSEADVFGWAIERRDLHALKAMLTHSPNSMSSFKICYLLVEATRIDQVTLIEVLLDTLPGYGREFQSYCNHKAVEEAIRYAANNSNEAMLRLLYAHFSTVWGSKSRIVLKEMCTSGREESVRAMLRSGARVDSDYMSLVAACQTGHLEIVRLLLDSGVDVNNGNPLDSAIQGGHLAVAQLLLERGANANSGNSLEFATRSGNLAVVKLLLDQGADVNACNSSGETALHLGCYNGHKDVVQLLLENDVDLNIGDQVAATLLSMACLHGWQHIVGILLAKGVNVNARNRFSDTALHRACENGHQDVVRMLLANGADVNARVRLSSTPLMRACYYSHRTIAQLLLENGADGNVSNGYPLRRATEENWPEIVTILRQRGVVLPEDACG